MTDDSLSTIAIVIPAFQPTLALVSLIKGLRKEFFPASIVVVNDGSSSSCDAIFNGLSGLEQVVILKHAVNLGKGAALKTAFNFVLNSNPHVKGVITADADGQHSIADIKNVAEKFCQNQHKLCLGSRKFTGNVPARSRVGNLLTRFVFSRLIGVKLTDTQTGLRGIPTSFLHKLLKIRAMAYEFELDMLVQAKESQLGFLEIPIDTIYFQDNKNSHFSPLFDSLRIYFVFLRFTSSSIVAASIDWIFFSFVFILTKNLLAAFVVARFFASSFNFLVNKKLVFVSKSNNCLSLTKYVSLVIYLLMISYSIVLFLSQHVGIHPFVAKLLVESLIFIFNFNIQRFLVFKG